MSRLPALPGERQGGGDAMSGQEERQSVVTRLEKGGGLCLCREHSPQQHSKRQKLFVVRAGGPDHSAAESHGGAGNLHTPFPQALISCNRLCQTIKELIADPYGK